MRTVLFVGAGRHQRRAIAHAQGLGYRVVAVDANPDAPGLAVADVGRVAEGVEELAAIGAAERVDGVLTISAERLVPVVAGVAERLGLPGIGAEVAHRMTNKVAMRAALAAAGVPQPRHATVSSVAEGRAEAEAIGFPLVVKPVDMSGQRGVARVVSPASLDGPLGAALAASPSATAMIEAFHDGPEVNAMVVVRDGEPVLVSLSDRWRPPGDRGFGVAFLHRYPSAVPADALATVAEVALACVRAVGLRDGIAYPQILATAPGDACLVEVAARIPGGQQGELVRRGTGVDLFAVALRQACGEPVPDALVRPRLEQPVVIRFLTAAPGPLRPGTVRAVGSLEPVLAADGVVMAETWLRPGDVVRAAQVDGDRKGWVMAVGESADQALARADAAAALLHVEMAT